MNVTENGRAITTVTVSRAHSLRDPPRQTPREEQIPIDNGMLIKNQRSFSNDKISTDSKTQLYNHQRGSSLRQTGKTVFPISSPISNNHHSFQIIKSMDTSPRTSESIIDPEFGKTSSKFKFKQRNSNGFQGGPLIIDHGLKVDAQRDSKTFTPRPPLAKKFSDQEDGNSDIDCNQTGRNIRNIQNQKISVPKPLISPTRIISQNPKGNENNCQNSIEKQENNADNHEEYTNGIEDIIPSDCEAPAPSQFGVNRSSLRKGSDSPSHSDTPTRNSPSPTKTVKWNPTLLVKNIPHIPSKFKDGKSKTRKSKSNPNKDDANNTNKNLDNETQLTMHINIELAEAHETFISQCTNLMKNQILLLENFRKKKMSLNAYQKDLIDQIEFQGKLISNFHSILTTGVTNCDKISRNSDF